MKIFYLIFDLNYHRRLQQGGKSACCHEKFMGLSRTVVVDGVHIGNLTSYLDSRLYFEPRYGHGIHALCRGKSSQIIRGTSSSNLKPILISEKKIDLNLFVLLLRLYVIYKLISYFIIIIIIIIIIILYFECLFQIFTEKILLINHQILWVLIGPFQATDFRL